MPERGKVSEQPQAPRAEHTARLIGWVDSTREKINDPRPLLEQVDMDRIIAAIVAKIGSSTFEIACDSGREITLEDAVADALEKG